MNEHASNGSESGLFSGLVKASLGACVVLAGAYIVGKIREDHDIEKRLKRLEELLGDLERKNVAESADG